MTFYCHSVLSILHDRAVCQEKLRSINSITIVEPFVKSVRIAPTSGAAGGAKW